MIRKLLRLVAKVFAATLVLAFLAVASLKLYLDATYFNGYDGGAPLNVQIAEEKDTPAFKWTKFYYAGSRGDRVPAVMVAPTNSAGPFPCVVFVHGIGNEKEFMRRHGLDEPFVKAGYAFVCFDQLMRGERKLKDKSGWAQAKAFRVRAACTVNDTRRLIDYLVTRPDIATNRIYLCGASYGAVTGSTAAAFDNRIRATALIYGGGNLQKLLSADVVRDEVGGWAGPVKWLAWYFCSVFDPVRYAGRISPRPVLLQNGKADTIVAPEAARALQDSVKEPKQIIWYEGDHLGKTSDLDMATTMQVITDTLRFLGEVDATVQANQPVAQTP